MRVKRKNKERWGRVQAPVLKCGAKGGDVQTFSRFCPERQDQNLALTVWCVPHSLDRGYAEGRRDASVPRVVSYKRGTPVRLSYERVTPVRPGALRVRPAE